MRIRGRWKERPKPAVEGKPAGEKPRPAAADKARIEELEKFSRLTTGREQCIIEFKRQVKELEEKLKAK